MKQYHLVFFKKSMKYISALQFPDQTGPTGALPPAVELDYNEHAQE